MGLQRAGVAFLAVGAAVGEGDAGKSRPLDRLGPPHDLVESADAAVQVIGAVVRGQPVLDAVQAEPALGDAVGVAADGRAEAGMAPEVVRERLQREGDVGHPAAAVGDLDRGDRGPVGHDLHPQAAGIDQRVQIDRSTVGRSPHGSFSTLIVAFSLLPSD